MLQFERQKSILEYIEKKKTATVGEIARAVYTSEASVRRDIARLESEGYVTRVYGGVMLAKYEGAVMPVELRDTSNSKVKDDIAKNAAAYIKSGDTVIMDASTTVFRICHYIKGIKNLKIITNNLGVFNECSNGEIKIYCTGGLYGRKNHDFLGPAAEKYLQSVNADLVFFSSQGITQDGEITDVSEEETSLRRVMLSRAAKKIFLCDSSKIGVKKIFTLCHRDEIDLNICDKKLPWEK
jgi:DeoR/GlpR family transcriptional regulator of sugar metabolism